MELSLAEVKSLLVGNPDECKSATTPVKQIVVCQRGWVMVGDVTKVGDEIVIGDAKNIRKWGTTSGLGQLAASGPTKGTVCDDYGTVRVHQLAVVLSIDAPGWK